MRIPVVLTSRPWILPTLIFGILVILSANMHPLWGDEAETALFARNILKYGIPKGWDGVNIMGIENAVVLNSNLINHTSPWGQYYLTAASFAVFGQSSFSARLPFIILSIISIPLIYLLTLKVTNDKKSALIATIISSLSVPFILSSYQDRYYAITSFCALLLTLSSLNLTRKSLWPKITFIVSGTLFFYGNYLSFAAFFASLFFAMLIFMKLNKEGFRNIKKFVLSFILLSIPIAALTTPWYLLLKPMESRGQLVLPTLEQGTASFFTLTKDAFSLYNNNNGLPKLLILALGIVLILKLNIKESISHLIFFFFIPCFFLITMSFFTLISVVDTTFIATRYTTVILPFFLITIAILISEIASWQKIAAAVVLVIYVTTNLFSIEKVRSLPLELAGEILNPYPTPDKLVADYLKTHAKDGDTAFVSINRNHEPLIFHLGDKIKFVNRVSLTNTRIFPKNRGLIPRYIYDFRGEPDWVIMYSRRAFDGSFLTFDMRSLPPEVNLSDNYTFETIPVFFSDLSRPEIELRSFSTIIPAPEDQVFIYKKIK